MSHMFHFHPAWRLETFARNLLSFTLWDRCPPHARGHAVEVANHHFRKLAVASVDSSGVKRKLKASDLYYIPGPDLSSRPQTISSPM